ncbi:metallophosphoesterase [uncultured Campylobacter sp.]|uniref:metallophosphoesterase n=1 Tax=uncultured Campylobacter sp. TaxID=218934 RepID=UPI00262C8BEF|nr:metallophosphoesterase [uncultured Campylobacter sp.]
MKSAYIFPIVGTVLFLFFNLYVYRSIGARFTPYKNFVIFRPALSLLCVALAILDAIFFAGFGLNGSFKNELLYKLCVFCMAASFSLFFICLAYDVLSAAAHVVKFSQNRRKFLKTFIDITFVIMAFSYIFKGLYNALKIPKVTEREIKIKSLARELSFAVISDVHLGEFLKKEFLQGVVAQINSLNYDALLIVGDMFDLRSDELGDILQPLEAIKKPIFFVTGNHEYYRGDASGLIAAMQKAGVRVLQNESVEFEGLNLMGVHDLSGFRFGYMQPDLSTALAQADPDKPKILLAHQPKYVVNFVRDEVDLCICGHTHAGQIFPWTLLVLLSQKYLYGLYNDGLKQIYVSSGVGFWGPPIRVFADAEIALLKLRKA